MDAIIFFYKKRDILEPVLTVGNGEGYRLVKVGICGGEDSWLGQPLPRQPVFGHVTGNADTPSDCHDEDFRKSFFLRLAKEMMRPFSRCKEKRQKLLEELEQIRLQKQYEADVCVLDDSIKKTVQCILEKTEILDDCACIYTDGVRALLLGDGLIAELWKKNWDVREFVDYREYKWARLLLPFAVQTHFVILGTAPCIPEVTKACARRMKSLRWILREKDCGEPVEDFIDDFYEDYGLAVELQTVTGRNGFRTLCLEAVKPICVLDFTDEAKLFWGGLASGSIWLDFASLEAKERRLERLAPGIQYVSLKKLWRG